MILRYFIEALFSEAVGIRGLVVNARHVKNVPSRKIDAGAAQWLTTLSIANFPLAQKWSFFHVNTSNRHQESQCDGKTIRPSTPISTKIATITKISMMKAQILRHTLIMFFTSMSFGCEYIVQSKSSQAGNSAP